MSITEILFRLGITTFVQDIITVLPATASTNFQVGKNLPTDVGFVYGLSTYADGLDPDGNTLITTTQAQGIYLTLQNGATQFLAQLRMDDLLNAYAGSPVVRPDKFTPVNIPLFDLSKSFYQNPNNYSSAIVQTSIRLKLWYIQREVFEKLENDKFFKYYMAMQRK